MPYFLHEYLKYRNGIKKDNGYWEIKSNMTPSELIGQEVRVVNAVGGFHDVTIKPEDEIVYAEDRKDLNYSHMLNPDSKYGWLAPDGTWYGCNYMEHEDIAMFVLRSNSCDLEEQGYVKIYESRFFNLGRNYYLGQPSQYRVPSLMTRNWLTQPQIDWLLTHGFQELNPDDIKDYWEGMFDNGNN
jgi:hypothetical protein